MVLPPLATIVAAAIFAVISTGPLLRRLSGNPSIQFLPRKVSQDYVVLFQISKQQRDLLAGRTPCTQEEYDDMFSSLAEKIRETYDREGYVIIRGLIEDNMMDRLNQAGKALVNKTKQGKTFTSLEFGPVFLSPPNCSKPKSDDDDSLCEQNLEAFREVSMTSAIPAFVAQMLLNIDDKSTKSLRILKDVFLAKGKEGDYCGWHVDDFGFWPTSTRATADMPGVNAWIAMDDIPRVLGGGLAVSPRSHKADWRHEAYEIIGTPITFPEEGFENPEDMFKHSRTTTCNMADVEPEFSEKLDESMHVFDFQKGDILFHTRWVFHRSIPITKAGYDFFEKAGQDPVFMRYSIRYEIGEARLLRGFSIEGSVLLRPESGGMTLDDICAIDAPWYPKCWPQVDAKEMSQLNTLVQEKLPEAKAVMQQRMTKLMPAFQKKTYRSD